MIPLCFLLHVCNKYFVMDTIDLNCIVGTILFGIIIWLLMIQTSTLQNSQITQNKNTIQMIAGALSEIEPELKTLVMTANLLQRMQIFELVDDELYVLILQNIDKCNKISPEYLIAQLTHDLDEQLIMDNIIISIDLTAQALPITPNGIYFTLNVVINNITFEKCIAIDVPTPSAIHYACKNQSWNKKFMEKLID